jgi:pyrroline-5-carboxylate reductase
VRPQNRNAIENCELIGDALIVSFLAGTPLARLPVRIAHERRIRVMTSAPDTIVRGAAIAGVYPRGNPVIEELLGALRVEQFFLDSEGDMHAFTALGVCLPIVLACWRAQGDAVDEEALMICARSHGLGNYKAILDWALRTEPRFATPGAREDYLAAAATPGGVTEAMIRSIHAGGSLAEALECGICRSEELSRGSSE